MLSSTFELICLLLASLLLFAVWPPLALLPWILASGWAAWLTGGWGRPAEGDRK